MRMECEVVDGEARDSRGSTTKTVPSVGGIEVFFK